MNTLCLHKNTYFLKLPSCETGRQVCSVTSIFVDILGVSARIQTMKSLTQNNPVVSCSRNLLSIKHLYYTGKSLIMLETTANTTKCMHYREDYLYSFSRTFTSILQLQYTVHSVSTKHCCENWTKYRHALYRYFINWKAIMKKFVVFPTAIAAASTTATSTSHPPLSHTNKAHQGPPPHFLVSSCLALAFAITLFQFAITLFLLNQNPTQRLTSLLASPRATLPQPSPMWNWHVVCMFRLTFTLPLGMVIRSVAAVLVFSVITSI